MTTALQDGPSRQRALDGLRGLAAIAIVVSHLVVATNVALSSQFFAHPQPLTGGDWLFTRTPLAILWTGQGWVIVFFVLSGVVLSLAASDGVRFNAARYYPARIVRLYAPVWACLVLAGGLHEVVTHQRVSGATEWLGLHATGWSAATTAREMVLLLKPGDYYYSTVLWTLRWEVVFSLLLPLFVLCARRFPLRMLAAGSLLTIVVGGASAGVLRFMPAFMLGTALAFGREQVRAILAAKWVHAMTALASPILMSATFWMPGGRWAGPAYGMVTLGATGLVAMAMAPGAFARALERKPMQFVGKRAFSLYLVHEPLIVATAFALGGRPSLPVLAACVVAPLVVITVLFHRGIERPTHTFARSVGRANDRLLRRAPARTHPATQES